MQPNKTIARVLPQWEPRPLAFHGRMVPHHRWPLWWQFAAKCENFFTNRNLWYQQFGFEAKNVKKLAKIIPHLYLKFDGFLTFSRCKMRNFVHWHVFTSMHCPSKIFLAISFLLHYISKTTTFFDNGNLGIKGNISICGSIIHELDNGLWDSKALNRTVVAFLF